VGSPFSFQVTATNGPNSFAVSSGSLPAGLNIDATTGLISGTPTAAGTSTVTLTATNAAGQGTGALTITVTSGPPQPGTVVITLTPDQVASVLKQAGVVTGDYSTQIKVQLQVWQRYPQWYVP
jgi:PKD repeat protein